MNRQRCALILILIAAATIVAYAPALGAGFIWDDDSYIEENAVLTTLGGLASIWFEPTSIPQYYPLVHTTFWVEYQLWGVNPFGYHLVNVLLHMVSAGLLFVLVRRLALPGALLVAGVFALHPVMVESVAWVTERKNVLSMVFYLSSALVYLRWVGLDAGGPGGEERGSGRWWCAFGLFLCALTSKSVTFSLPFAILLVLYWRRGVLRVSDWKPLLPFIAVGVAYGFYTSYLEHTHVGANGPEFDQTVVEKVLVAGRTPWFYIGKLLWPQQLVFIYDRWDVDAQQLWQWMYPLATLTLLGGLLALKGRIGRGPLVTALLFGGTLFPALGFITVFPFRYSFVADHFQYHACLAILVGSCSLVTRLCPPRAGVPIAVVVLGLYGVKTWSQTRCYESRETLYNQILADDPGSWFARNNLASIYVVRGEVEKGLEFYRQAKQINPGMHPGSQVQPDAYAHCMVAKMLANTYTLQPAIDAQRRGEYQTSVQTLAELRPHLMRVVDHFRRAVDINPGYVEALRDCGRVYHAIGTLTPGEGGLPMMVEAARLFGAAVEAEPTNREVRVRASNLHMQIAQGLDQLGRKAEAAAHRASARRLRDGDPEYHPGVGR